MERRHTKIVLTSLADLKFYDPLAYTLNQLPFDTAIRILKCSAAGLACLILQQYNEKQIKANSPFKNSYGDPAANPFPLSPFVCS